jgi:hypothetical protein
MQGLYAMQQSDLKFYFSTVLCQSGDKGEKGWLQKRGATKVVSGSYIKTDGSEFYQSGIVTCFSCFCYQNETIKEYTVD